MNRALPNSICPLCGGANQCAPAAAGTLDVPCWCTQTTISREALARVPADRVDKACLCPRCAGVVGTTFRIREATLDDLPALEALIARSIRTLGMGDYTSPQIEAALLGAFGVDTQLIRDRSYFVVEDATGRMVGCGGWSRRRTLFGSDAREGRDAAELDPAVDAAKIRAFFVAPDAARRGIGSLLLKHCEAQARAHGFDRFELMATLPGVRLYEARGYRRGPRIRHPLGSDLTIEFVPMEKDADLAP